MGAALKGRVLVLDDVISSGISIAESIQIIRASDAEPVGIVVALDRQERSEGTLSAIQEVENRHGIPVVSIITLDQIMSCITGMSEMKDTLARFQAYREQYGVETTNR